MLFLFLKVLFLINFTLKPLSHLNDPDSIILNNATDWLKGYSNFHKGKYFEERLENLDQLTSIAFFFPTMEVNGAKQLFGSNRSFVFSRRKKLEQVCNNLRVSK